MGEFAGQSLAKFKVIFDLFYFCFYFIQQQNYKVYYANLLIISEIQSKSAIGLVTAQISSIHRF